VKTIGFLGGMSWESTAEYYRLANEAVASRLGGLHSARCLMLSVDFADIEAMQVEGRWEDAGEALGLEAQRLQAGGADFLVLCTNTMHKVAAQIEAAIDIPMLNLADTTARAVRGAGVTRVGLLGTRFTMEQSFYRDRLAGHGIDVVVPDSADIATVNRIIYDELCLGIVHDESRATYLEVIDRLIGAGVEGVVLGCTEIELLVGPEDIAIPAFPTARIHVEAAVDLALA
jgi:aspartate racemase